MKRHIAARRHANNLANTKSVKGGIWSGTLPPEFGAAHCRIERKIIMANREIPYKIYLEENELPRQWYNVRADMKNKPAPLLNPATHQPCTLEELSHVFCTELAKQELDDTTPYIDIPEEIIDFYKMYRPAPLVRA